MSGSNVICLNDSINRAVLSALAAADTGIGGMEVLCLQLVFAPDGVERYGDDRLKEIDMAGGQLYTMVGFIYDALPNAQYGEASAAALILFAIILAVILSVIFALIGILSSAVAWEYELWVGRTRRDGHSSHTEDK